VIGVPVRVRQGTVDDAEAVAAVHVRAWQTAYAGIVPDDVLAALDPVQRAKRRRTQLADPHRPGMLFVAVCDGAVVGFAEVGPGLVGDDQFDDDTGQVYALYVDPGWWRRGVGQALLDVALAHLLAARPRPVRLWVLAANTAARRFYERYGFAADGTVAPYTVHCSDGTTVDLDTLRYVRTG